MYKTIVRRLLILIPQLFVISLLVFILAWFMPGDALTGLTADPTISPDRLAYLRDRYGLNDPWYRQYVRWLSGIILRGDFGFSIPHARPVMDVIGERIANTFRLAIMVTFLTYLIGVPLGIIAGRYHGKPIDKAICVYTYIALAMPTVVLALVNLLIFGFRLGWVPVMGSVDIAVAGGPPLAYWLSRLHHLILPAITATLLSTIGIVQYLRSEIIEYKVSDFVTTARSKGVPPNKIYSRHIFRNALIPMVSDIGFVIVGLVSGFIFIERIFSFPGMGLLFLDSIMNRDYPVVIALITVTGALIAVGGLLSDIILTIVDPRIRIK